MQQQEENSLLDFTVEAKLEIFNFRDSCRCTLEAGA